MSSDQSTSESIHELSMDRRISDVSSDQTFTPKFDNISKQNVFKEPCADLTVTRPLLTVPTKHEKYMYSQPIKQDMKGKIIKYFKNEFTCSVKRVKETLYLRLPFLNWMSHYDIEKGLLGDIISGFTVAIMNIPQGMAYATLANVDPIVGIYMAFFPVLVYVFLGSSRHVSMGTFAVICLMTGKVVSELATFPDEITTVIPLTTPSYQLTTVSINETEGYTPIEVATITSFGVGIWMLLFGLMNLGSLSVFLSRMLVSGFTTGAAIHVFTSQVKSLFGVTVKSYNGAFKVILTWGAIFKNILDSNPTTMVISMICVIVILFNNEVIKPRLRKVTMIPVPIELIVVVVGTLASRYGHLDENYGVTTVGNIPTGLPPPTLPQFDLYGRILLPALIITIVSYTISYSMAKTFAIKFDYLVDATQELYANGFCNLVGSLFQCAPISSSLSRTLIQVNVGGYSQLTSLISCSIILLVLLFIGPFFETLPNCVLAAIIVTALKGMFLQFGDFTRMMKISGVEASVWMVTFLGVVLIDIDYGLFIGIGYSIILLLRRNQKPSVTILGRVPNTDIYLEKMLYACAVDVPDVKLCQISGPLHYANEEYLRSSIIEVTGINPRAILSIRKKKETAITKLKKSADVKHRKKSTGKNEGNHVFDDPMTKANGISSEDPRIKDIEMRFLGLDMPEVGKIVFDLSGVNQIDITSAKTIGVIYAEFTSIDISVYFAGTPENCLEIMAKCGVLKEVPEDRFYHSTHDVVSLLTSAKSSTIVSDALSNHL